MGPRELEALGRQWAVHGPLPREFHAERWHDVAASRAYAGFFNDDLGGIAWVRQGPERATRVRLKPGEVEITDVYTMPSLRGRGLFSAVIAAVLEDLGDAQVRTAWAHVAPGNAASLRVLERAGFRRVELVSYGFVLGVPFRTSRPIGDASPSPGCAARREVQAAPETIPTPLSGERKRESS